MNTLYFSDRSTRSSSALLLLSANRWLCSWMIQFSGKTNKAWQIQIIVCRRDKVIMRKCIGGNWSFFQEAVWFTGHANNNFLCVPPLMGGGWSQRWGWKVHAKRTDFIMMQYPEESTEVLWPLIICGGVYWKAVWLPLRITYRDRTMAGSHWVTAEAVNESSIHNGFDLFVSVEKTRKDNNSYEKIHRTQTTHESQMHHGKRVLSRTWKGSHVWDVLTAKSPTYLAAR